MPHINKAVNTALLAGEILLQSGAETSRVEDTVLRMLNALGFADCSVLVLTTGLFVSVDDSQNSVSRVRRVNTRTINLDKIDRANTLSRQIQVGEVDLNTAYASLQVIKNSPPTYRKWQRYMAAGVASSSFAYLFGANPRDLPFALLIGICTAFISEQVRKGAPRFIADFIATFFSAILAILSHRVGLTQELAGVIIGAIMILVPGVLITTAVQDALSDDLLSSISKVTEAIFIALAVAGGVTLALSLREVLGLG